MSEVPTIYDLEQRYWELHEGLSDMIESGRLTVEDIPDDYQWLVETLASNSNAGDSEPSNS